MPTRRTAQHSARELSAVVAELDEAEAYVVKLRQLIADARDQLAAGNVAVALSMLNGALSDIDASTDVVAPTRGPT